MTPFKLKAKFQPTGDQPRAIEQLTEGARSGAKHQTLLGVTGSGKTFTAANVIEHIQKPALVISHNKTLAAQLYQEFREFFPENAVHYFVSYYDYYQPEAYIPRTDTYIEKDAKINEMIDGLRHASTASILTRRDVLIVASVSCIYGIGDPEEYRKISMEFTLGERVSERAIARRLATLQYARNPIDPRQGNFRIRDNTVDIHIPSGEETVRIELAGGRIARITRGSVDPKTVRKELSAVRVFPAKHFVTPQNELATAIADIRRELKERLAVLKQKEKVLEATRLKQRTEFDMETLAQTGYVNGIENYSRHLEFRESGTPPRTLIDYFHHAYGNDFLTLIDESHATVPQLRGMYAGDRSRKQTLVDYGFRLPSAMDNRPLTFDEFTSKIPQTLYLSATPALYELKESGLYIVQQLIRPTGILDPALEVRPTKGQILDVIREVKKRIAKHERSLVLTLTKRLAEDVSEYLQKEGVNAEYLHSEIKTLERSEILKKLRGGEHDVLVGINLLREGLDLPEVSFIAILDADKEGFLRNETTLLQIIGRAARHVDGTVILYADTMTGSMRAAIRETNRRRKTQQLYNRAHHITPQQITKEIRKSILAESAEEKDILPEGPTKEIIKELEREMKKAAKNLDFERAAAMRDRIEKLLKKKKE